MKHSTTREHVTSRSILILGKGGHAAVVAEAARAAGIDVAGFSEDRSADAIRARSRELGTHFGHIAIGSNHVRERVSQIALEAGLRLIPIVHPSAVVPPDTEVGPGAGIMAGAVVQPRTRIGAGVILNTGCSVDHECDLASFSAVAPGARLSGGVRVGTRSWIGLGAVVLEGRRVGDDSLVGAGAVVTRDIPPGVVAYGNPARVIRPWDFEDGEG